MQAKESQKKKLDAWSAWNVAADFQLSAVIARNAGGRLLEIRDFDNLSEHGINELQAVFDSGRAFYLGDRNITSEDISALLTSKFTNTFGIIKAECNLRSGRGPYVISKAFGVLRINSTGDDSGSSKAFVVVTTSGDADRGKNTAGSTAKNLPNIVHIEPGSRMHELVNGDLSSVWAIARESGWEMAGAIDTIMKNMQLLDELPKSNFIVDSKDAKNILGAEGYYEIDRAHGEIKPLGLNPPAKKYAWFEITYITRPVAETIRKGLPVLLKRNNTKNGEIDRIRVGILVDRNEDLYLVTSDRGQTVTWHSMQYTDAMLRKVESARTELMEECKSAIEEKKNISG